MRKHVLVISILLSFIMLSLGFGQDKVFQYVGAAKCKTCHRTAKIGEQYQKWESGPHAGAFTSLSSEKSMEFAKKNNIADPAKDANCLKCHSTAAAADAKLLTKTITIEEGVSCESCHGPGSEYKSMKIMKDHELSLQNGLIVPDEKLCVGCHNPENPFHKEFKYEEAVAKIAHPIPGKAK